MRLPSAVGDAFASGDDVATPAGYVDRAGARAMFGVTRRQWTHWITDGKVTCGIIVASRNGGRRSIYPIDELRKLREALFAREHLYKNGANGFQVPPGWARRHETCQMLGVDKATWQRWQSERRLPCGQRFEDGPVLFRIEDVKRMFYEMGHLAPPSLDPAGSGAYRVPLWERGSMGSTGLQAIVDPESLSLLDGAVLSLERVAGGQSTFVALCRPEQPRGVPLRRIVLALTEGDLQVRHLNGDPLDCRRANLCVMTIQERSHTTRKMRGIKGRPCSSRFKGVFWDGWAKKWRARIVRDGKSHSIARFHDELAAAQAYDEAARELFGEHARLNFPDGIDAYLENEARRDEQVETRAAA